MHLARFVRQWTTMRRKMTTPDDPDFAYFSQFLSTPRDGFAPAAEDTDFRSFEELMRRQIKPAWYHFSDFTRVRCGVRALAMHSLLPPAAVGSASAAAVPARFGFVHAFEAAHAGTADPTERDATASTMCCRRAAAARARAGGSGARPPAPAPDSRARRASQSLDVFLLLFPRGRVLIHLPASPLPLPHAPPQCACAIADSRHEARGGVRRARRRSVARYARPTDARACAVRSAAAPRRAAAHALTAANQPLHNGTHLRRLSPSSKRRTTTRRARPPPRIAGGSASAARRRGAAAAGERARLRRRRASLRWCPPERCKAPPAKGAGLRCVACPATLGEWA